jgi:hypothetical protein
LQILSGKVLAARAGHDWFRQADLAVLGVDYETFFVDTHGLYSIIIWKSSLGWDMNQTQDSNSWLRLIVVEDVLRMKYLGELVFYSSRRDFQDLLTSTSGTVSNMTEALS